MPSLPRVALAAAILVAAMVVACGGGGGGMAETPAEPIEGGGSAAPPEARPTPNQPTEPPAAPAQDNAGYRRDFEAAVRAGWTAPNRDRSLPPRIGVVLVQLGHDGTVAGWTWRRRSPDGPFNDQVESFLNGLVGSRRAPLPASGTPTHSEVTGDGLPVQFADPDA